MRVQRTYYFQNFTRIDVNVFQNCVLCGNKTRKGTIVLVKGTLLNKKFIKYISLSLKIRDEQSIL